MARLSEATSCLRLAQHAPRAERDRSVCAHDASHICHRLGGHQAVVVDLVPLRPIETRRPLALSSGVTESRMQVTSNKELYRQQHHHRSGDLRLG